MTNREWVTFYTSRKGSLITSFPITNRLWVASHILVKGSPFMFPLVTREWVTLQNFVKGCLTIILMANRQWVTSQIVVEGSFTISFPMSNRLWVTFHISVQGMGSLITSFFLMTNREWVTSHTLWKAVSFFYDQQGVSDIEYFLNGSLITFFLMTEREWVIIHFCERQYHHISSYDQYVSGIAHFVKESPFLMTNSMQVTFHIFMKKESHHIFFYNQQDASDIANFVKGNLITSFTMTTGSEWYCIFCEMQSCHIFVWPKECESPLQNLQRGVSPYLFLWPTGCEWHGAVLWKQSHHLFLINRKQVTLLIYIKGSFITSFPLINRLWVTSHIFVKTVSSHLFLWLTACEWMYSSFCERQPYHIYMVNRLWVTLYIFVKVILMIPSFPMTIDHQYVSNISHLWKEITTLNQISYDGQYVSNIAHFCENQSHNHIFSMTNRVWVMLHIFVKGSLIITSFPITNRMWVTLQILWKAVLWSYLFLWPTGSQWHCTFCERQSHPCIFSHGQ